MQVEIEFTQDQTELNIGKLRKNWKAWNSSLGGCPQNLGDHHWSAMLAAILDINCSQKLEIVEPLQAFLMCLVSLEIKSRSAA